MTQQHQLRLTYFDTPGRAEPVRVALFIAGLPFEDRRLKFPEFAALKEQGAFPLGSVPVLEIDGRPMVQTGAILRYVARLAQARAALEGTRRPEVEELYPSDPRAAFVVDSALDTFNDTVAHALTPSMFERDMEKKLEMRRAFVAGPFARASKYVESLIAEGPGPFLTGPALTIADIVLGQSVQQYRSGLLDGITEETLAPSPLLRRLGDAYAAHSSIQGYAQRPR
jgi:glutathione S-transferase